MRSSSLLVFEHLASLQPVSNICIITSSNEHHIDHDQRRLYRAHQVEKINGFIKSGKGDISTKTFYKTPTTGLESNK